jgi:YD repeat-containing protein
MGSMIYSNGTWIYTSPSNEIMKFDMPRGRLIELTSAKGVTQKISYVNDAAFNTTATVTDSRGHKLTFKTNISGQLSQMEVGSLTVKYTFDASGRLISTSRQWPGRASMRGYLYEDTGNPQKLTGIIDERGVRSATWAYDDQGRAVLNERASGADKVSITYADDGSVTAKNATGQSTVYRYNVVQGVKRVSSVEGAPAPACPASNSSYTYTAMGQIESITDALGNVTAFTYDDMGRETRRVEASGSSSERVTSTTWDGNTFRPETITTSDRETKYGYDEKGRLVSTIVHPVKE